MILLVAYFLVFINFYCPDKNSTSSHTKQNCCPSFTNNKNISDCRTNKNKCNYNSTNISATNNSDSSKKIMECGYMNSRKYENKNDNSVSKAYRIAFGVSVVQVILFLV